MLLNNGDGTFVTAVGGPTTGGDAIAIAAGDFSGDGRLDLALAEQQGYVEVLMGNGDGTFQPAVDYQIGGDIPYGMVAGDFTGNGKSTWPSRSRPTTPS